MKRQIIQTPDAPQAIGTYSQAVRVGNTVYLSGQIPLVPETMQMISGDINEQVKQVFSNLKAVAQAAGGTLTHIIKLTIYLTDLKHFPLINEAMQRYFSQPYPARAVIEVSGLPKDALVEIEGIMQLESASGQES